MIVFDFKPLLLDEHVSIRPLVPDDFEELYAVAKDPLIWEQHPNPDRYKKNVFELYFKGAIESNGAFMIYDTLTNHPIGSSRYYDFSIEKNLICIGYTFLARDHWGSTHNHALKKIMLNHAFKYVDSVIFHIGANNIRSQKAMEKLGGIKTNEIEVAYYSEPSKLNFEYEITQERWNAPQ